MKVVHSPVPPRIDSVLNALADRLLIPSEQLALVSELVVLVREAGQSINALPAAQSAALRDRINQARSSLRWVTVTNDVQVEWQQAIRDLREAIAELQYASADIAPSIFQSGADVPVPTSVRGEWLDLAKRLIGRLPSELKADRATFSETERQVFDELMVFAGGPERLAEAIAIVADHDQGVVPFMRHLRGANVSSPQEHIEYLAQVDGLYAGFIPPSHESMRVCTDALGEYVDLALDDAAWGRNSGTEAGVRELVGKEVPNNARVVFTMNGQQIGGLMGPEHPLLGNGQADRIMSALRTAVADCYEGDAGDRKLIDLQKRGFGQLNHESVTTTRVPFAADQLQFSLADVGILGGQIAYATFDPETQQIETTVSPVSAQPSRQTSQKQTIGPAPREVSAAESLAESLQDSVGGWRWRMPPDESRTHAIRAAGDRLIVSMEARTPSGVELGEVLAELKEDLMRDIEYAGVKGDLTVELQLTRADTHLEDTFSIEGDANAHRATRIESAFTASGTLELALPTHPGVSVAAHSIENVDGRWKVEGAIHPQVRSRIDPADCVDDAIDLLMGHATASLHAQGLGDVELDVQLAWSSANTDVGDAAPARESWWSEQLPADPAEWKTMSDDARWDLLGYMDAYVVAPAGYQIHFVNDKTEFTPRQREFVDAAVAQLDTDVTINDWEVRIAPFRQQVTLLTTDAGEIIGARATVKQRVARAPDGEDAQSYKSVQEAIDAGLELEQAFHYRHTVVDFDSELLPGEWEHDHG